MSENTPDHNHPQRGPGEIPILHGPMTPAEQARDEKRKRRIARDAAEEEFKNRQVEAVEAANRIAGRNATLTGIAAIIAAVACIGSWYQGWVSSKTLKQMKSDAIDNGNQFQAQIRHYDDGLGRTGLLAQHAGEQAHQTTVMAQNSGSQAAATQKAAAASQDSANTAKEALHTSQRAYIVLPVAPSPDFGSGNVALTFSNLGHLPSSRVSIRVFEATYENPTPNIPNSPAHRVEAHWRDSTISAVSAASPVTYYVTAPMLTPDRLSTGKQTLEIGGTISYQDGFPDTPTRTERFCFMSIYDIRAKATKISNCDPKTELDYLIFQIVEFPKHEERDHQ